MVNSATEQVRLVRRRRWIDFGQDNLRHNGVLRKGRSAYIKADQPILMKQGFVVMRKPASVIEYVAGLDCGGSELTAVALSGTVVFAFSAFRDVERNHRIARPQTLNARPVFDYFKTHS